MGKKQGGLMAAVTVSLLAAVALVWLCLRFLPAPAELPEPSSSPTHPVIVTTATTTTPPTTTTGSTTTTTREIRLQITSHKKDRITTTEPFTVFTGTCDPQAPLMVNGETVPPGVTGAFSLEYPLTPGDNVFRFEHKGDRYTYTVHYDYVVMQSHAPAGSRRLKSGAVLSVVVTARQGSTVKATFNGKTITLREDKTQQEEGGAESATFVTYSGSFTLPGDNTKDLSLGKVKFTATHRGQTDIAYSGNITCEKAERTTVAEIVAFTAETFNGNTADDDSRPTNNYLPEGTVDYVVGRTYFGDKEYLNLRCGRRVYVKTTQGAPITKETVGVLPETNRLAVAGITVDRRFTTLTLDTQWKAPFLLDLLPQTYTNPAKQDYTVSAVTCEYVEIRFCYAAALSGEIAFEANHPLFIRAEIKKEKDTCLLRLYLRRTGGFYGWDAVYNKAGQLVFTFLHPAQVTAADTAYGADLTGVTVMLDVGHGGSGSGAAGLDSRHPERERNLYLAGLLREELESMGATVVLNRTADSAIDNDARCQQLKSLKPDLCVAIHHDANASSRPNGFGSFHSTLFSREAARYIYEQTMAAGIYDGNAPGNRNRFEWHYYFVARMSDCPVVLTENGFMTSQLDHTGIVSPEINRQKAKAIAAGVARYFLSIRLPDGITLPDDPEEGGSTTPPSTDGTSTTPVDSTSSADPTTATNTTTTDTTSSTPASSTASTTGTTLPDGPGEGMDPALPPDPTEESS